MNFGVNKITGSAKAISTRLQYGNRVGGRVPLAIFPPPIQGLSISMGCVDLKGSILPNFQQNLKAFFQSKPPAILSDLQKPVLELLEQTNALKAGDNYFIDALRLGNNRSLTLTACFARAIIASVPAFFAVAGIVSGFLPMLGIGIMTGLSIFSLVRDFISRKQIQQNIEEFIKQGETLLSDFNTTNELQNSPINDVTAPVSLSPSQNGVNFFGTVPLTRSSDPNMNNGANFYGTIRLGSSSEQQLERRKRGESYPIPSYLQTNEIEATSSKRAELRQKGGLDYFLSWLAIKYFDRKERFIYPEITAPLSSNRLIFERTRLFLIGFQEAVRSLVETQDPLHKKTIAEKACDIWDSILQINPAWKPTRRLGSQSDEYQIITRAMLYFQKGFNDRGKENLEEVNFFNVLYCLWAESVPLNILYQAACLPDKNIAQKALSRMEKHFPHMAEEEKTDCARVLAGLLNREEVGNFGIIEAGKGFSFSLLPELRKNPPWQMNFDQGSEFLIKINEEFTSLNNTRRSGEPPAQFFEQWRQR